MTHVIMREDDYDYEEYTSSTDNIQEIDEKNQKAEETNKNGSKFIYIAISIFLLLTLTGYILYFKDYF